MPPTPPPPSVKPPPPPLQPLPPPAESTDDEGYTAGATSLYNHLSIFAGWTERQRAGISVLLLTV